MDKGAYMEELLRNYFLSQGFYVVRGLKYRFAGEDVTDVDVFLYKRISTTARHRGNVDIKNKKTPQAMERILWANGVKNLLNFNECIVATTDSRPFIHDFAKVHNTTLLDGNFTGRLKSDPKAPRLSEDDLMQLLGKYSSLNVFKRDWRFIVEESKSRLLSEMDYSGFNAGLSPLQYFVNKSIVSVDEKKQAATRALYAVISHLLVIIDYICKDLVQIDEARQRKSMTEGFLYGNLGKDGATKLLAIARKMAGTSARSVDFTNVPADMLAEFFTKRENVRGLMTWALAFEQIAYGTNTENPTNLDAGLKSVLGVFLDFLQVPRRTFFDSYASHAQTTITHPVASQRTLYGEQAEIGAKSAGKGDTPPNTDAA
ncbi:MAG: hypothetical protein ABWZ25_10010 [Chitinophagaceae bacterium]